MLGCWPMMAVSIMQTLHTGSVLSGPQQLSASLASYRPLKGNHNVLYDIAPQRPEPLSMEDYVGLPAYDGCVHHANTAHRVCSVRSTAFVCISGQLQTFGGESYRIIGHNTASLVAGL